MLATLQKTLVDHPVRAVIAAAVLWIVYRLLRPKAAVQLLPVPSDPDWIFGHEKAVAINEPGRLFKQWANNLGLTYRIKAALGAPDVLVLCDPAGIGYILQKKVYDYHHSAVVRPRVERLLGKGLGWVEGEAEHKRMRQLISSSLSHENLRGMSSDVKLGAMQIVDDLTQQVQAHNDKLWINLFEWTGRATITIVGRVAFLHDFEGGKSDDAKKILNARRVGVSPAMRYAGFITLMLLRRFSILNRLPIPAIQAQGLTKQVIQSGVAREIIQRNQDMVKGVNVRSQKDLLARLLIAHDAGKVSEDELLAQISTLIIAGNDTSTQTLAFLIWELARHPDVQERLREEAKSFAGEPTYDDYQNKLPYLDAVLKEALRKYPGLPYMERVAMKDDVIPLREPVKLSDGRLVSELPVTAGQVVLIPILSIHRMDSVFPDAEQFRPERWLDPDFPRTTRTYSGWANMLVFSDGPRNCIGMRLGLFQMKVTLAYMIQRFRFVDTGEDITYRISSSLQAWVTGRTDLGPCMPVQVELL